MANVASGPSPAGLADTLPAVHDSVHLPLPLHKSGQPSGWRNGEDEEGRNVRRWGRGGAMQRGARPQGAQLGQPQRGSVPGAGGVGKQGDACGCKPLAGPQMQDAPQ